MESPQLEFAMAELSAAMNFDNILFAIQQVDEKHFHESRITAEKIASDRIALAELQRRKSNLEVKAEKTGTFLLHHYPVHTNSFLAQGMVIGEIVSGDIVINAYVDDSKISNIAPGDYAVIYTRDSLKKYLGKITEINTIPVQLTDSLVLQSYGGSVPVYFDEKTKQYLPDRTLYRIVLKINGNHKLQAGRFTSVKISHSEQLFKIICQFIISALRKEF